VKARKTKKAIRQKDLKRLENQVQQQAEELENQELKLRDYHARVETLLQGMRDGLQAMDHVNYQYLAAILVNRMSVFLNEQEPHNRLFDVHEHEGDFKG